MTTSEINGFVDKIITEHNGKGWKVLPNTLPPQCFDLAVGFTDLLGVPHAPGNPSPFPYPNASQIYTDFGAFQVPYFDRLPNDATFVPKKGDVVVWDKGINNNIGHVSVATGEGDTNHFKSFDQNWSGPTCQIIDHNYNFVLGVLRPKVTTTPSPDPMLQKKASRYDVIEQDDKGSNIDTNKITDAQFEATRLVFKDRKIAGGKWDQICDRAGLPHSATIDEVALKLGMTWSDRKSKVLTEIDKLKLFVNQLK